MCAAVSLVGIGATHYFVEPYGHGTLFGRRGKGTAAAAAVGGSDVPLGEPT